MTGYRVEYYPGGVICYHEDCRKAQTEPQPGVYIQPVPPMPMREWVCMNHFGQYINDGLLDSEPPEPTHVSVSKADEQSRCDWCEDRNTLMRIDGQPMCIGCLAENIDEGEMSLVHGRGTQRIRLMPAHDAPKAAGVLDGIEVAW